MLRKIRKMLQHQEGFTLVELMIVVVILGILAGVGIQQYGRVQENARISAHNANVRIIMSSVQMMLMAGDAADAEGGVINGTVSEEDPVLAYLQEPYPTSEFTTDFTVSNTPVVFTYKISANNEITVTPGFYPEPEGDD